MAQGSDTPTVIWTMVELGIAIVSACLPTLRPLFSRGIDGLHKLRSNSLRASSSQKPSDPQWPGNATKEVRTPPSPESIAFGAESERKLRELLEKV